MLIINGIKYKIRTISARCKTYLYIYRLAPCTENCSQRIYKTFSIKYLEHVHIFSTFEPKKHKSVFQAAVSTCTLKILCCGYNLATQKRRKFINNYDTRRYEEYSFSSLSAINQREVSKMSSLWSLITVSFECGPVLTSLLSPYQGIKTEKRIILS